MATKQLEVHLLKAARETVTTSPGTDGSVTAVKAGAGGHENLGLFHNTALLVKALLSKTQPVANLPIDELYETAIKRNVPIEEWPQFIMQRYGIG